MDDPTIRDPGTPRPLPPPVPQAAPPRPLSTLLTGPLSPRQAAEWCRAIAEQLARAHGQGRVHGDLRAENVLLDSSNQPLLEGFRGQGAAAGDQLALGILLYQMLTGLRPLDRRPPSVVRPEVPRDIETICMKAMDAHAAQRYESMKDLAEDLGRFASGSPIRARRASVSAVMARAARRRPGALIAVVVLLAVAGVGVLYLRSLSHKEPDANTGGPAPIDPHPVDEARTTQLKGTLAARVIDRWTPLGEAIVEMGRVQDDPSLSAQEKASRLDPLWQQVDGFLKDTPEDVTSRAVSKALAGVARRHFGRVEEGMNWIDEARKLDPDVPYGALMKAMVHIEDFLAHDASRIALGDPLTRQVSLTAAWGLLLQKCQPLQADAARASVSGTDLAEGCGAAISAVEELSRGQFAQAEAKITPVEANPAMRTFRVDLLQLRALARHSQGNEKGALADVTQAIGIDPNRPGEYYIRGAIREASGDAQGADEDYDRCIQTDPAASQALLDRARTRLARGDEKGAMADFDLAVKLVPDSAEAHLRRGQARFPRGDVRGAIEDMDAALHVDSGNVEARVTRAICEHIKGDLDKAIEDCTEAIVSDKTYAAAYLERGFAKHAKKDLDGAVLDYGRAIENNKEYAEAWFNRARAKEEKGDLEGALTDYNETIRLKGKWSGALAARAALKVKRKDAPGAAKDYLEALKEAPRDWPQRKQVEAALKSLLSGGGK